MHLPCLGPLGAACALLWAASAAAQPAPSLREAAEAAWRLTPEARSAPSRADELDARERAAGAFLSGAPSIGIAHRTDRPGNNAGLRENEAEISAPLWLPRVKAATRAQVDADRVLFKHEQQAAKARVAAEVRDLAAQAAIARIERDVALRKAEDARALVADVSRRVRAGDSARVDQLQAEGAGQQAGAAKAQADAALVRALSQWRAVTGLDVIAELDEAPAPAGEPPALAAARSKLRAAEAKLRLTEADRADPPEVGVGVTRERPAYGAAGETSLRIALRVPLGSYGRNAPKLAAALAELGTAQAEADAALRLADAERGAAEAELAAARAVEEAAGHRARTAAEVHALIANAFRLGEGDLPSRLRADAERYEAERAHARARIETRRAISRFNQANGFLP